MHVDMVVSYILCVTLITTGATTTPDHETKQIEDLEKRFTNFQKNTKDIFKTIGRQLMLQQFHVEERIRSEGDSGIKQSRVSNTGTRPYYVNTHTSVGVASAHDHANYDRTIGLGEFIGVMNGVEFRTRHNDYKLRMPSSRSKNWNELEDIPFPPIPPSVLQKRDVKSQIDEMRTYFKAFYEQSTEHRDWKPYFKPVMCYLEGGWTTNTKSLEEPFHSDRHQIEASSWLDLQEKIRFTSNSGSKNNNENLSYLPTTVVNITEDGIPILAQWNYRIVCHPIKAEFNLSYIRLVDEASTRLKNMRTLTSFAATRAARFAITPQPGYLFDRVTRHAKYDGEISSYGKLDEIMAEIPGKDNYPGILTGDSFGSTKYRADMANETVMNTARYHRMYKTKQNNNETENLHMQGFSDKHLWVAETSSPRIASLGVNDCHHDDANEICTRHEGRYTYAVPLEIIWMTPLSTWNPYNITMHDWKHQGVVTAGGRFGDFTPEKAYNGISPSNYYLTPAEFFTGREVNRNPADTVRKAVGVLDQTGQVRRLSASGVRFFLPAITDIGTIRLRYPIMPIHQEGNAMWKNVEALQDIILDMGQYERMFERAPGNFNVTAQASVHYVTTDSRRTPPQKHLHDVYLSKEQIEMLKEGTTTLKVYTSEVLGHQHVLELKKDPNIPTAFLIVSCDGHHRCFDRHGGRVYKR